MVPYAYFESSVQCLACLCRLVAENDVDPHPWFDKDWRKHVSRSAGLVLVAVCSNHTVSDAKHASLHHCSTDRRFLNTDMQQFATHERSIKPCLLGSCSPCDKLSSDSRAAKKSKSNKIPAKTCLSQVWHLAGLRACAYAFNPAPLKSDPTPQKRKALPTHAPRSRKRMKGAQCEPSLLAAAHPSDPAA